LNKGIWYAFGAYAIWGTLPIYWKWLAQVPALQLIGHRIIWSFLLLSGFILVTGKLGALRSLLNGQIILVYLAAGILLSANWLIYVWAVNADYIIETSLGYFINPLLSVVLGVVFLRERLRTLQWVPVAIAALGVVYLTVIYGSLPWIALTLAGTFGIYGLVKKVAPLGSLFGLTLETGLVFLPALAYLIFSEAKGSGAFGHTGLQVGLLLAGVGLVTTVPLLLFASAARRIPLTMVGIMQYIAPTLQFLIGVLVFKEPFTSAKLVGFAMVWFALMLFWLEDLLAHRAQKRVAQAL
jgi:chloramphenicol-sensitive protein RarD